MSAPIPLPDAEARQRIRQDLDTTLLVEAAAGTGKTTEMVNRMIALLRTGRTTIDRVAAITFTRKAAAQLRQRFQVELEKALQQEPDVAVKQRLEAAYAGLHFCFTGTIHSFCARLLRERPVEAGVDPDFLEIEEDEFDRAGREFWIRHCQELSVHDGTALAEFERLGLNLGDLESAFLRLAGYPEVAAAVAENPPRPDLRGVAMALVDFLDQAAREMPNALPLGGWDGLQLLVRRVSALKRQMADAQDPELFRQLKQAASAGVKQKCWPDKRRAKQLSDDWTELVETKVAPAVISWMEYIHPPAIRLAHAAAREFQEERVRTGRLGYQDLLWFARQMIVRHTEVRTELGNRFTHLLVDEFQDTDPLQAEVMVLLGAGAEAPADWRQARIRPGALFVVGDPKQSIYRFRRADIATYNLVKEVVKRSGGRVVELTACFRSVSNLCNWVNQAFDTVFPEAETREQARHVHMHASRNVEEKYGGVFRIMTAGPFRGVKPDVAGAEKAADWVQWALQGGWQVAEEDRKGKRTFRPAQAGDILVMTWNTKPLAAYARAFEARGIPCEVTGAKDFAKSAEVAALQVLLRALADLDDPIALVACLRGPFFGVDDLALYRFKVNGGRFHLFAPMPETVDSKLARALELMRRAAGHVRVLPPGAAVSQVVNDLGLSALAATQEFGNTRAGNLLKVAALFREWAAQGHGFHSAVGALERLLKLGKAESLGALGPRGNAVHLMNLHQAKGLEAPIVILAGSDEPREYPPEVHIEREQEPARGHFLIATPTSDQHSTKADVARPMDWDRLAGQEKRFEASEDDRLLYVAATRARNTLVIGGHIRQNKSGDNTVGPWTRLLGSVDRVLPEPPLPPAEPESPLSARRPSLTEESATILKAARQKVLEPTYAVTTVTGLAHDGKPPPPPPGDSGRGADWGSAVHHLLERAIERPESDFAVWARHYLLNSHLPAEWQPDLLQLLEQVRSSPLWKRVQRADERFTEVSFSVSGTTGGRGIETVLNGTIDLVFREGSRWVIVDYKTDIVDGRLQALLDSYRPQVQAYLAQWSHLVGAEVSGLLLFLDSMQEIKVEAQPR